MKERPILFSAPMVRSILDGSKTQTRRVIKPQPYEMPAAIGGGFGFAHKGIIHDYSDKDYITTLCPYGQPGDRIWVRERHQLLRPFTGNIEHDFTKLDVNYYATDNERYRDKEKWRPSIHMPRWASRITLEITGVRVQRLQEISERDAWAEGCEDNGDDGPSGYAVFEKLWESINGDESWAANPWVWVIEFKKL